MEDPCKDGAAWGGGRSWFESLQYTVGWLTFLFAVGDESTALQAFFISISVTDTQPG